MPILQSSFPVPTPATEVIAFPRNTNDGRRKTGARNFNLPLPLSVGSVPWWAIATASTNVARVAGFRPDGLARHSGDRMPAGAPEQPILLQSH